MKALPICLLLAALASTAAAAVTETIQRTEPLRAGGVVSLTDVNGAITITAWDRDEVAIEAVKRAPTADDLARIHVKIEAQPDRITITTEHEKTGLLGSSARGEVAYTLHVPARAILRPIESVNSQVTLTGMAAPVVVHLVNGGVHATGLSHSAEFHSVNGGVRADFARLPADARIDVETVNGGCELRLPADGGARIDVRSVNGGIHCDLPVTLKQSGHHQLRGTIGGGGAEIHLQTVNGGITIRKS